jgi:hypothetical protein
MTGPTRQPLGLAAPNAGNVLQAAVGEPSQDDWHLLNACLEVERWALRRECRMAQHLLLYEMFGEEELCEALGRDDLGPHQLSAMHRLVFLD